MAARETKTAKEAFDLLTALFDRVGLKNNTLKLCRSNSLHFRDNQKLLVGKVPPHQDVRPVPGNHTGATDAMPRVTEGAGFYQPSLLPRIQPRREALFYAQGAGCVPPGAVRRVRGQVLPQ